MKLTYYQLIYIISSYPILDSLYPSLARRDQIPKDPQYNYDNYDESQYLPVKVLDYSKAGNVHEIEMKFEKRLDKLELIPNSNNHTFLPADLLKETGKAYLKAQDAINRSHTKRGMDGIINEIYANEFKEEAVEINEAQEKAPPSPLPRPDFQHAKLEANENNAPKSPPSHHNWGHL